MSGPFRNAIEGIQPKSRGSTGWFVIILILFVVGGIYFTLDRNDNFTNHDASDDFSSLIYGFQSLAYGDISGFIEGMFGGITIVALFMIMFALLHFILTTALKPIFTKKKYATVLATVLTIYGFVNPTIYNYLLNLNAFAVGFFVFLLLVIMLWSFTSKAGSDVRGSFEEIANLKKNPQLINDKAYVRKLRAAIEKERRARR